MYQVYPRTDMEGVLAGTKDGGEHMRDTDALAAVQRLTAIDTATLHHIWKGRDRVRGRLYVAGRRGRDGYIIARAMPRLPQDGPTLFDI